MLLIVYVVCATSHYTCFCLAIAATTFFQLLLDKDIEDVLREDVFRTFEFISLCSIFVRGNFMIADSTWRTVQLNTKSQSCIGLVLAVVASLGGVAGIPSCHRRHLFGVARLCALSLEGVI